MGIYAYTLLCVLTYDHIGSHIIISDHQLAAEVFGERRVTAPNYDIGSFRSHGRTHARTHARALWILLVVVFRSSSGLLVLLSLHVTLFCLAVVSL